MCVDQRSQIACIPQHMCSVAQISEQCDSEHCRANIKISNTANNPTTSPTHFQEVKYNNSVENSNFLNSSFLNRIW